MNAHGIMPISEDIDRQVYEQILSFIRLRVTETYAYPPEIVQVDGITIATLGNFSASVGKPKSKKTFNCAAIVASALSGRNILHYKAHLPEGKHKVLYVDTEQSKCHCHKVLERILKLAGMPTDQETDRLVFFMLREYSPKQRRQIINHALAADPEIGFVVIDGIRDLMYDINSPSESVDLINDLMRWSSMHDLHIHTVLHLNKGDDNTRGHIGTELNNKAETVLLVEKDKSNGDISKVSAMHIRAMDFEPFAFRVNDRALPELMEDYQTEAKTPGRPQGERFDACKDISEQQHRIALEAAFSLQDEYGYKELSKALKESYALVGVPLSDNKLVKLITVLKNKRMIVQENGRKYRYEPDFHY